jgi:hypothetical protein
MYIYIYIYIYISKVSRVHRWVKIPQEIRFGIHRWAYSLKKHTMVPLAHIRSSLSKIGAYVPCHSGRWGWINAERAGPKSLETTLHEAAWKVIYPRSRPWILYE